MARHSQKLVTYFVTISLASLAFTFYYTSVQINALDLDSIEVRSGLEERQGLRNVNGEAILKNGDSCSDFDHGDVSPLEESVSSIFNCGSKTGTCQWYFPAKFLNASCGIGKEFKSQLDHMKKLYDSRELWIGGPPIVLPSARIDPQHMKPNKFREGPWPKHNLSMVHVHKTGGTSLVYSFDKLLRRGSQGIRRTVYAGAASSYDTQFYESSTFLDGAVKYHKPGDWGTKDHTIFAVVRDPAERFISAIGQAAAGRGSNLKNGKQLLNECLKETSKETLKCFIDLIHRDSTWLEVHFTPMVLEISFATIYKDIPVAIFPFTEVPNLLIELGANPNDKKKDGHKKGQRKSQLLVDMSTDDYDADMLQKLCKIYEMDVMFMNHLGLTTTCDKYTT
jgi:hypothetical protein